MMGTPRQQTIRKQVQLPLGNAVRMAWQNIRVRPGRSLLVMSGIVLAIAFLTNILCSNVVDARAAADKSSAVTQLEDRREVAADGAASSFETRWMAGLALMIAFVGILNAMLLSVTERFQEIGTMKCLGAIDSLIIRLFLLESLFQGGVGTLVGIILGVALTLVEAWTAYNQPLSSLVPLGAFLKMAAICFSLGVGLTVLGALYPAWRAARMPPVAALRSEV